MGTSVISASMPIVNLTNLKFSKIQAEVGPRSDLKGGNLHVSNEVKLTKLGKQNAAVGSVSCNVTALPNGVDDRKIFAFRVSLTVEGVYEWEGDEPIWTDPFVEQSIMQSLYVVGTLEVANIAKKLGFPNVELPLDLKISKLMIENAAKQKPRAKKSAVAKVGAKSNK
jgi:hypothetical protein